MDDEETGAAAPYLNRNLAFSQGLTGGQSLVSDSLAREADRYNAMVPKGMIPSNSGDGMSAGQYDATMGGALPVQNGMASNQYQLSRFSMRKS